MIINSWEVAPASLNLISEEIHLWRSNLDLPLAQIHLLKPYLSIEEINRSDRFKFDQHRHRYIVSRANLRIILGKYLNLDPAEIEFIYDDHGKPRIKSSQNHDHLEFNMSHSQNFSLYGIVKKYAIGVDVEYHRKMSDADQISERFFTEQESALIKNTSEPEKLNIFFQLWTAKEAYLKCTGEGIAGGLDQFAVKFDQQKAIGLLGINPNLKEICHWYFSSFLLAPHYQGAVVVNRNYKFNLKYFEI